MGLSVQADQERRLTIVVPVHRMAGRLSNLESSISAAEGQAVDFVLVLDDTGDSSALELQVIAATYPGINIRIVKGVYQSPGFARNAGMQYVSTPYILFADSDDRFFVPQITAALNSISDETEVLIGAFRQTNLESDTEKIFPPKEPLFLDLALNPGLWRIVLKTAVTTKTKFKIVMKEKKFNN